MKTPKAVFDMLKDEHAIVAPPNGQFFRMKIPKTYLARVATSLTDKIISMDENELVESQGILIKVGNPLYKRENTYYGAINLDMPGELPINSTVLLPIEFSSGIPIIANEKSILFNSASYLMGYSDFHGSFFVSSKQAIHSVIFYPPDYAHPVQLSYTELTDAGRHLGLKTPVGEYVQPEMTKYMRFLFNLAK